MKRVETILSKINKALRVLPAFFVLFITLSAGNYADANIEYIEDLDSLSDEEFYEEIQKRIFSYFIREANPENGLVRDRAHNFNASPNRDDIVSCASSGMGIAALCIGHKRGWIDYDEAYERVVRVLESYYNARESDSVNNDGLVHYKGFFYHFTDMEGNREWDSELSTIDTAILVSAALFAGEYFSDHGDDYPKELAEGIYERIDWKWMTNNNPGGILEWGWTPEEGFDQGYIGSYSEGILAYIMGAGAPEKEKRLDDDGFRSMRRPRENSKSLEYIFEKSLFTHQYPQLFIDLSGRRDDYACYASNSFKATVHHRRYVHERADAYDTYSKYSWGLGAADSWDGGYHAYGIRDHDGTVALSNLSAAVYELPCVAGNSLRYIYNKYETELWGKYGFSDSFNTDPSIENDFNEYNMWRSNDVIGVQQGAVLVAIENHRSGLVNSALTEVVYVQDALERLGFREKKSGGSLDKADRFKAFISEDDVFLSWEAPYEGVDFTYVEDGIFEVRFSTDPSVNNPWESPDHYLDFDIIVSTSFGSGQGMHWRVSLDNNDAGIESWPDDTRFWIRFSDGFFNWSEFTGAEVVEEKHAGSSVSAEPDRVGINENFNRKFSVFLKNENFKEGLGRDDIELKGNFSNLAIESVSRVNSSEAEIEISGNLRMNLGMGAILFHPSGLQGDNPLTALVEVTENILRNPSFEKGSEGAGSTDFWDDSGGAQIEEWAARSGDWGYGLLGDEEDGKVWQEAQVSGGKIYDFSLWGKRDSGILEGDFFMKLDWLDSSGDTIYISSVSFQMSDVWEEWELSAVSPKDAEKVEVSFGSDYFSITGDFYSAMFDDASLISRKAELDFIGTAKSVSEIQWEWNDLPGPVSYSLYCLDDSPVAEGIKSETFTEKGFSTNTAVGRYLVARVEGYEEVELLSSPERTVYTLSAAPRELKVLRVHTSSAALSWQDKINREGTRYGVSYARDPDFSVGVSTPVRSFDNLISTGTGIVDLSPATTYYFRTWSYNDGDKKSGFSNTVSTRTLHQYFTGEYYAEFIKEGRLISRITLSEGAYEFPTRIDIAELSGVERDLVRNADEGLPEETIRDLAPLRSYIVRNRNEKQVKEKTKIPDGITARFYYPGGLSRAEEKNLRVVKLDENSGSWVKLENYGKDKKDNWIEAHLSEMSVLGLAVFPYRDISDVYVYPNPYIPGHRKYGSSDKGEGIVISGLPAGAKVRIFNVAGSLVDEFTHREGSFYRWGDAANLSSGVYILVVNHDGNVETGKFSVIQ